MEKKVLKYYSNLYDKADKEGRAALKMISEMRIKNLDHLRSYWFNLIIWSSAVMVAILPLLIKDSQYFNNAKLAVFGVVLLGITDIVGCFYINVLLTRENRHLAEKNNFYEKTFSKEKEIINKLVEEEKNIKNGIETHLDFLKKTSKEEEEIILKQNTKGILLWWDRNFSDILTTIFIFGALFIIFSFIPVKSDKYKTNYNYCNHSIKYLEVERSTY